MRLTSEIRYDAAPGAVFDMLVDAEFQKRKCVANGSIEHEVEIQQSDEGGAIITTRRTLPTSGIPDFVRAFLGGHLTITEIDTWGPPTQDGTREGTVVVQIEGKPVRLTGVMRLATQGAQTVETIAGELKASVPLLGGKIEEAAAPAIQSAIRAEQNTGTAWLSGHL